MDVINWNNYTGADFQNFCNALLSFEIGRQFVPFSAPGKDKGYDGLYQGDFAGKSGKWRFQYKFHSVARRQAFSLLKEDIKKEVLNVDDEKNFVFITNVELLPQELTELYSLFFNGIKDKKEIHFEIWDGAKLFNTYLKYPILEMWLNEGFQTAQLQDYRAAFNENLANNEADPSALNNYFVSRTQELEKLEQFLQDSQVMALIAGEAGIGKTRIVIEFFKKIAEERAEWQTLVLMNRAIDFDRLQKALSGGHQSVILVDDAHTFKPEILADLKRTADIFKGAVKLILTSRIIDAYSSLELIKEYEKEKILKIELRELSRDETVDILRHELGNHPYQNYIQELATISHGKPILIMALIKAARSGTSIAELRNDSFLSSYVHNYFAALSKKIIEDTAVPKIKLTKLLQFICLIEPFSYSNTVITEKLASICGIEPEIVTATLAALKETGISQGRYEQTIRPDYYSDILLMKSSAEMIGEPLPQLIEFLPNIIMNLSSVDEVDKQENSLLDAILNVYLSAIDYPDGDIQKITKVFTTISSITYQKPLVAQDAVGRFLAALGDKNHPISADFEQHKHYYYQSPESISGRIKTILHDLLYKPSFFDFVFKSLLALNKDLQELKAENTVLHFGKRDYIERFNMKRQEYFVKKFSSNLSSLTITDKLLAIRCCKLFLQLDFTSSSTESGNRNTLTITTYFLPESAAVKKFRAKVIALLEKIYTESDAEEVKLTALMELLDVPRGIFATQRNSTAYTNDAEISQVLDFLLRSIESMPATFQKEVLDKLFWYRKWGIADSFNPKLSEIDQLLKPRSLSQQIIHLLAKSELGFSSRHEEELLNGSREILTAADPKELGASILELLKVNQNRIHYLWSFLSLIQREFPEKAVIVYVDLWKEDKQTIYQYGAGFLQMLYFRHKMADFYWQQVAILNEQNSGEADNVLLRVYSHYSYGENEISSRDISLIRTIAEKRNPLNHFDLARALQTVLQFDVATGKELSVDMLSRCSQREADIFFVFLGEGSFPDYETIKSFALYHSLRFGITYEIEKGLNKVARAEGAGPMIDYFIRRFEVEKKLIAEKKSLLDYEWVPSVGHSHLFEGCEDAIRIEFFIKSLDWFINTPFEPLEHFMANRILEYAIPSELITEEIIIHYRNQSDQLINDKASFERLLESLQIFKQKDNKLADLVIDLFARSHQLYGSNTEQFKEIRYLCYAALTTMGVKSGTAGKPFQVDLDLRDLLKLQLVRLDESNPSYNFLKDVLKTVEKDIESEKERYNEPW